MKNIKEEQKREKDELMFLMLIQKEMFLMIQKDFPFSYLYFFFSKYKNERKD